MSTEEAGTKLLLGWGNPEHREKIVKPIYPDSTETLITPKEVEIVEAATPEDVVQKIRDDSEKRIKVAIVRMLLRNSEDPLDPTKKVESLEALETIRELREDLYIILVFNMRSERERALRNNLTTNNTPANLFLTSPLPLAQVKRMLTKCIEKHKE